MSIRVLEGDIRDKLLELPDESVHCVVTSPPYYGLRDYGVKGMIGLEATPAEFLEVMVEVFREVRRVLRKDGTCWVNLGDSYWNGGGVKRDGGHGFVDGGKAKLDAAKGALLQAKCTTDWPLKPKDMMGMPWRVAFALQADGWYLRQDIIWSKPNPMPESVTDRCTKAHEYLFLLSKSPRYHFDQDAIREPHIDPERGANLMSDAYGGGRAPGAEDEKYVLKWRHDETARSYNPAGRNRRSVWTVATQAFSSAHFATFPPALIEPCIKAGCPKDCCAKCGAPLVHTVEKSYEPTDRKPPPNKGHIGPYLGEMAAGMTASGFIPNRPQILTDKGWSPSCSCDAGFVRGTVLDPFGGAGTTGLVADRLQRDAILIELNPEYAQMARDRLVGDGPLFADVA